MSDDTEDELMSLDELDALAADIPFIEAWLKGVKATIKEAIEAGHEFKHAEIQPTQPRREWVGDPLEHLKKLGPLKDVAPRVPLSPSQAQKKFGLPIYRDRLAEHVTSKSSGTKLVFTTTEKTEKDSE